MLDFIESMKPKKKIGLADVKMRGNYWKLTRKSDKDEMDRYVKLYDSYHIETG